MNIRWLMPGLLLTAWGALGVWDVVATSGRLPATATVTGVKAWCEMTSFETGILSKTTTTARIDCGTADAFIALHPGKQWVKGERYDGAVRVERDGQKPVMALMPLEKINGRAPRVGDVFDVLQDPANPSDVERPGQRSIQVAGQFVFGAVGLLLLFVGLRGRPRRPTPVADARVVMAAAAPAGPVSPVQPRPIPPRPAPPRASEPRRSFGRRS